MKSNNQLVWWLILQLLAFKHNKFLIMNLCDILFPVSGHSLLIPGHIHTPILIKLQVDNKPFAGGIYEQQCSCLPYFFLYSCTCIVCWYRGYQLFGERMEDQCWPFEFLPGTYCIVYNIISASLCKHISVCEYCVYNVWKGCVASACCSSRKCTKHLI
jgi:hypothetical protein